MFRSQITPTANVYLSQKWDMIQYEIHRFNVKYMKPRIDLSAPALLSHLYLKKKKLQKELERFTTIQRENRNLLDRLATIQRKGGWTDNKNYHEVKGKNTTSRQMEMVNLSYSNKIMLERIKDMHSTYNKNKLEDEYVIQQKHKALVAKYPKNWRQIKEAMQKKREEIRRKYVYPRGGRQYKASDRTDQTITTKDSVSESEEYSKPESQNMEFSREKAPKRKKDVYFNKNASKPKATNKQSTSLSKNKKKITKSPKTNNAELALHLDS